MRLKRVAVIFVLLSISIGFAYLRLFVFVPSVTPPVARRPIEIPANKRSVHLLLDDGRYPKLSHENWTPWLSDAHVYAVTPFALNGHSDEWHHTNWVNLDEEGHVLDKNELCQAMKGKE